jgi:hypothetical protein
VIPNPTAWAAAAAIVVAVATGWTTRGWLADAQIARMRAEVAAREAKAADDARRRLEAAQNAAQTATELVDRALAELEIAHGSIRDAIQSATTGRACLSARARGLLHASSAFRGAVPAAAAGADRTDAAAAADPGHAAAAESSDSDVAAWALEVASLYQQCRARIDAIRLWRDAVAAREASGDGR